MPKILMNSKLVLRCSIYGVEQITIICCNPSTQDIRTFWYKSCSMYLTTFLTETTINDALFHLYHFSHLLHKIRHRYNFWHIHTLMLQDICCDFKVFLKNKHLKKEVYLPLPNPHNFIKCKRNKIRIKVVANVVEGTTESTNIFTCLCHHF